GESGPGVGAAGVAGFLANGVVAFVVLRVFVAAASDDESIAIAADERVVAVAAGDLVVASAAVDGELDEAGEAVPGSDGVVAAIGVEDEIFGCADIKEERRRVEPVETHARAVGGDREGFGAVAAIDLGSVDAVAALEQVAVVAGVPDHAVVAALAEDLVVAIATGQHVVARAAEQLVGAAFAQESVVARAAEQQIRARAAGQHVIAGAAEELGGGQRAV